MARVEASVVIKRPVGEVFAYVSDETNSPEWESYVLEAEQTSEGPMGLGSTLRGVGQFLGRRMEWTSQITGYEPNRKVDSKIDAGPMQLEESTTFEPVEGGTRVTKVYEGEPGGFFKVAERIVVRMLQRQVEGDLANLKDILEAQA